MTMLCPQDGRPCCDDLCHGGGCMALDGYPMLERCHVCGGTVDTEIPECSTCSCDDLGYGDPDEWREEFGCCLPPGECCMPGLHYPSECHTAADYERAHHEEPARAPDGADAFAFTWVLTAAKKAASRLYQIFSSSAFGAAIRRSTRYHRAKFHRHPKRRALRK